MAIDAVTCPSLVVRGELSPLTTADRAQAVARRLGGASIVVIPGGGHDLGVEQPEAVAEAILEFTARDGRDGVAQPWRAHSGLGLTGCPRSSERR